MSPASSRSAALSSTGKRLGALIKLALEEPLIKSVLKRKLKYGVTIGDSDFKDYAEPGIAAYFMRKKTIKRQ